MNGNIKAAERGISASRNTSVLPLRRGNQKKPDESWSEWQDSNLRPLLPERKK
jgi:hypothetical protein